MADPQKENLTGKVVVPADLVAYQPGSIVSRMLAYKKSGTITLFAFDEGEGLSEHTAPYDAILTVLDGEAAVTIAGAEHQVKAGELIIMPANVPHAVHAATRFKMMLTMIHE
ncbi:cupin domain-containing protein [Methanoculleus sp. FWC-SCC1]|uniref:Cupin domain-containing protein n=1 Tax=Methanoculleus frigidifontis TaxID=2584085 RepID=A0ABT8M9K9_9EURY|nr:cupin domain-containing protein [Methanoculleus sp. FWC-SCC1]MDN7024627.1 cupin domain-containing protein [Methanoculleus sp. FWC-SCC1]